MMTDRDMQCDEYLSHMFDSVPCGILYFTDSDENPIIVRANAACKRIYGIPESRDLQGRSLFKPGNGFDVNALREHIKECRTAKRLTYVLDVPRSDGRTRLIDCTLEYVRGPKGDMLFQEVFLDETNRLERERRLEATYRSEVERRRNKRESLISSSVFDVTEDKLTETTITNIPEIHLGMPIDAIRDVLLMGVHDERIMAMARTRFTRDSLIMFYETFHRDEVIKYCRTDGKRILWVQSDISLRVHPETGHLMAFVDSSDVTDEELKRQIAEGITRVNYDFYLNIDCTTGAYRLYVSIDRERVPLPLDGSYETARSFIVQHFVLEEDRARVDEQTRLDNVLKQLETVQRYQVSANYKGTDGSVHYKALAYFYTDREARQIAMTVSDITKIHMEEERKTAMLREAMETAQSASRAKGTFLSQMSHEIRTPLNAVIGYLSLASEPDSDESRMRDCISQSLMASKHLLSIINDVLDMSSIESGRMKIASEQFDLQKLLASLTAIFYAQAQQKGIELVVNVADVTEEILVGDSLRVNQILMNLLSNAMKFTPAGGQVSLAVKQLGVVGGRVQMRMTVRDTGCGMSKEYMSRLFKPFEQQDATTARKYGGSGLGLSITRNLITMMGGQIEVQSQEGEGTCFDVTLAFGVGENRREPAAPTDFSRLRALVVDDMESDREYVRSLLKRCKIKCDTVCSGEDAVKQIERRLASGHPYDMCLMDWHMPGMNGIQTARCIRDIPHCSHLPIIIATAYDSSSIEREAREAGVTRVIAKPLFQSTMFDTLVEVFGKYVPRPAGEQIANTDLSGLRILLVEDNDMNADIATRFLVKYGLEVTRAENGREALNVFAASEPGMYDAILMDVQMPVMDGYEATRRIRLLDHKEAKSMPIIAMTANAFAEDVTAALACGMNDHVSKPIEYGQLFTALTKYCGEKLLARRNAAKAEQINGTEGEHA